jgi:hypothetical protein
MIGSMTADNLFAGSQMPVVDGEVVIAEGEGSLARGTLLGRATKGTVTFEAEAAAKGDGNTGNGTLVLDSETPVLEGVAAGVYSVRVIRAAVAAVATTPEVPAQLALAALRGPGGAILAVFDVPGTTGATVANGVKFVMTEGLTPFAVGDGWDITVTATETEPSGLYKAVDSAATDGSAEPLAVLAWPVDATDGDVTGVAYFTGEFNEGVLAFGGVADTADTFREAARARGLIFRKVR